MSRIPPFPPVRSTRRQFVQGLSAFLPLGGELLGNLGPHAALGGDTKVRIFHVDDFGARGDCDPVTGAGTDDVGAINAAIRACHQSGGGLVVFDGAKTYRLSDPFPRDPAEPGGPSIILRARVSLDGQGCRLFQAENAAFIGNRQRYSGSAAVTADIRGGATAVPVDRPDIFTPGETVFLRIGENGYILIEPMVAMHADVVAVRPGAIEIGRPIPRDVGIATATARNRRVYKLREFLENITVTNFNFITGERGNPESGVRISNARALDFNRLRSRGAVGAGIVVAQFVEESHFSYLDVRDNHARYGHQAMGRGITLSNVLNTKVTHFFVTNPRSVASFVESHCRGVEFANVHLTHYDNAVGQVAFFAAEESEVTYRNVRVRARNSVNLSDSGGTPADYVFEDVVIDTGAWPKSVPLGESIAGILKLRTGDAEFVYDFKRVRTVETTVALAPGMYENILLPEGLVAAYDTWLSPEATEITIAGIYFGSESNNGYDIKDNFTPGRWRRALVPKGPSVDSNIYGTPQRLMEPRKLLIVTAPGGPELQAELRLRLWLVPRVTRLG